MIENECNMNKLSSTNLGITYAAPNRIGQEAQFLKIYLSGSHNFKVLEIEVFKILYY